MNDRVGKADHGGMSVGVGRVVALDGGGDRGLQAPAADQDGADQRVVDPQVAALAPDAGLGCLGGRVGSVVVAVELGEHELSDVVEQGRDGELVGLADAGRLGDAVGGVPGGKGVPAEPLVAARDRALTLEGVIGLERAGDHAHPARRQRVDGLPHAPDARGRPRAVVRRAHHGDRERGVGLDGLGDIAGRLGLAVGEAHQAVAGLAECGQPGDRFEGVGKSCAARARAARASRRVPSWLQWRGSSLLSEEVAAKRSSRCATSVPLHRQIRHANLSVRAGVNPLLGQLAGPQTEWPDSASFNRTSAASMRARV